MILVRSFFDSCLRRFYEAFAGIFLASLALPGYPFDLQSHRGGRGLLPENTLAAFENAIRMGTTTLELDIAITADGIPVISHDPALNPAITRDTNGQWLTQTGPLIKSMTLAQLQRYDVGRLNPTHGYAREFSSQQPRDGQRIPTLASLFKLVNDLGAKDIRFDMETKINPHHPESTLPPREFVETLLAVIRDSDMTQRVMVQSFDWRTLELLHQLEPAIRTMYLTVEGKDFNTMKDSAWTAGHHIESFQGSVPHMVRASAGAAPGVVWAPHYNHLNPERIKVAQSLALEVIPWTVNEKPLMEKLIAWGVDGIISDYPDRLREVMTRKGLPLPSWKPDLQRVRTQGTQWVKEDGSPIALKGVNLGNWLLPEFWMMGYAEDAKVNDQCTLEAVLDRRFGFSERERLIKLHRDNWMTERDWDLIPQFGLNMVRLPFIWSLVEDEKKPHHLRADAWHYLDSAIAQAEKRGLYVVLDLHGVVGSQGTEHHSGCAGKNLYWSTPEYQERTRWLWKQIATRYKDHSSISAYDVLNEPWGSTPEQLAAVVKTLYADIRAIDSRHIILLPDHPKGIAAYGKPSDQGMHQVAFETHPYPGFFGWGKPGSEVHRDWLQCRPVGSGVCDWQRRMAALDVPLYIGEFQPWAELEPELSGQIARASYDRYAELGWASSAWSYKKLSREGGRTPVNWGLVTNAKGVAVAPLDFESATLAQIEDFFKLFGSMPYELNAPVLKWMNSVVAPRPFDDGAPH